MLAPALLLGELWGNPQIESLRDSPAALGAAVAGGLVVVGALAALFVRRPDALPLLAVAALPFRIPVETGGEAANLLVPLYVVVAGGVAAYAWSRLRGEREGWAREPAEPRRLELALVAFVALYAVQAGYSTDFEQAVKNVAFFYVPFALLLKLLTAVEWTRKLAVRCLAITRRPGAVLRRDRLLGVPGARAALEPEGHRVEPVRELLPRQLAVLRPEHLRPLPGAGDDRARGAAAVAAAAARHGADRARAGGAVGRPGADVLAVELRRAARRAAGRRVRALAAVADPRGRRRGRAGGARRRARGARARWASTRAPTNPLDKATSGRFELLQGGLEMWLDRPSAGYGSGSFAERFREREDASSARAASASHTIPMTIAAEQGIIGLAAYVAVLFFAFKLLFERLRWRSGAGRRRRRRSARTIVAAAFAALVFHTMTYAAFLEDPITWTLLGLGIALRVNPVDDASRRFFFGFF